MDKALDLVAIMAHPDDAELACGGTLCKLAAAGKRVGVVDLTRGELGSRGTPELRAEEAAAATQVMGLAHRENLALRDGFFESTEQSLLKVIAAIRKLRPQVVLTNAPTDRHPDHGRAHELVLRACFLAGLQKIETTDEAGAPQTHWRPRQVFACIQDQWLSPSFVVDISAHFEQKMQAIACYSSQFWVPGKQAEAADMPVTPISTEEFWFAQKSRAKEMGHFLRVGYAEGFIATQPLSAESPLDFS